MGTRTGTYVTGTVTGTVGSGITMMDNILVTNGGWTKVFTGTNEAAYQMADAPNYFMYVNDNAPHAAGAREMRVRGYESMSSISTGTNPFPLTTMIADADCVWRKSSTLDATARNYYAVVDGAYVVLVVQFGTGTSIDVYRFGKIESFAPTDTYNVLCAVRRFGNDSTPGTAMNFGLVTTADGVLTSNSRRAAFARTADGLFLSPSATMHITSSSAAVGYGAIAGQEYPGRQLFILGAPILCGDLGTNLTTIANNSAQRGLLPFEFEPVLGPTVTGAANLDTMTATAYEAGSSFLFLNLGGSGRTLIQTAGDWKTGI